MALSTPLNMSAAGNLAERTSLSPFTRGNRVRFPIWPPYEFFGPSVLTELASLFAFSLYMFLLRLRYPFLAPHLTHFRNASTGIPNPPPLSLPQQQQFSSSEEIKLAREWLQKFAQASIPRQEVELSFARSSGPGGQNVNKVNTKATVRCSLDRPWIPVWARSRLRENPSYAASSHSLLVTSTQFRSQAQNIEDCFKKLHNIIYTACTSIIPTPADPKRLARKEGYERAMKAKNRAMKAYRSSVKSNRRGD